MNGVRSYAPSTWLGYSRTLLNLARWDFDHPNSCDTSVFERFTRQVMHDEVIPALSPSKVERTNLFRIINRLIDAGERGVISDWPRHYDEPETAHSEPTVERIEIGAKELVQLTPSLERNWQPFSDIFTTEFISRSIWIIENIAEDAIRLWLELREIPRALGMSSAHPTISKMRAARIADFVWTDKTGEPIFELPFVLHYRDAATTDWPPIDTRGLNRVIGLIQSVIAGIVAFCTGARSSEILGAKDTPQQLSNDRFHSRVFKFSSHHEGTRRDWPLHPIAVRGVRLQQTLSSSLRQPGTDHLWVMLFKGEDTGTPLHEMTGPLTAAVEFMGLSDLTGDDAPHIHRWRHTMAQLIAITLTSSPQILQDLFGHDNIESTLTYLCSNPDIVELALKVAEEASHAMMEEVVSQNISGETSGPAANTLEASLQSLALSRGEIDFSATNMRELIEILTFNGRTWSVVRPGVLCTKADGQFGPCTRGRGAPDPGACRTSCDHRLETARAERDCEESLEYLVIERAAALADGNNMLVARLDGEIRANLKRWDSVRARILNAHPHLQQVWLQRDYPAK
ncbi:integrase [Tardiphaga sp. 20_F10_N6_6]|uniref:integrase n=1 Tax=Tardiphaga sp. 20_F10_N6_6 TaxID=3240788 RepID=UPI003F8A8D0B